VSSVATPRGRDAALAGRARWRRFGQRALGPDWRLAALFVGPALVVIAVVVVYPFLDSIYLSFTQRHVGNELVFVGLRNYTALWNDSFFRNAVKNSIVFTVYSEVFKITVGMVAALLLHNLRRGRSLLTGLVLLPWIIPTVVTALDWRSLVDPLFGSLNDVLTFTRLGPLLFHLHFIDQWPATWLGDATLAMPVVVLVNIWKGIPFFTIVFLAGLKAIPQDEYEAASVDGANAWDRFRNVTLPGLKYPLIIGPLLSTIWTFNTFDIVWLMTQGGPANSTMPFVVYAYEKAIEELEFGPGAAVALTMLPITAALVFVLARYIRRSDQDSSPGAFDRFFSRWGRWLALAGAVALVIALLLFDAGLLWKMAVGLGVILAVCVGYGRFLHERLVRPAGVRARRSDLLGRLPMYLALAVLVFFVLAPMYWLLVTAFKTDLQEELRNSILWPRPWTLVQFHNLTAQNPFWTWYRNTLIVAAASTVLGVGLSAFSGYAIARLRFRGAQGLMGGLLLIYIMPSALLFIPLYQIFSALHLINSLWSLIVAYPTFTIPFASWLLMGYFRSIPAELEESAMVDGASRFAAFSRIVLPLARPALLAVALFTLTNAWNEFLFAYVFITNNHLMTLPVGMQSMIVGDILPWGQIMAASILVSVPVVVLYGYAQRFLVEGLTVGAIKG
jgi:multiple sugar transport system permease protein